MSAFTSENALFAPLFSDREVENLFSTDAFIEAFTRFEIALTDALGKIGLIDAETSRGAVNAMAGFAPDPATFSSRIAEDGLAVPAYVNALKARVGAHAAGVHVGATSQDLIDTAFSIALRGVNALLDQRLDIILGLLAKLESDHGSKPIMGYTRMRAALDIKVADRIQMWRHPIETARSRLGALRPLVEVLQLGGPVGDRRAFGQEGDRIAAEMADALGLFDPGRCWHTDRSRIVDYGTLLGQVSGALGKLGQDICLMAQQIPGELTLTGGGSSSAMPHKQNPVRAELLVTLARYNATQIGGLHHALLHEQERSGAAWTLEWIILPEMVRTTGRATLVAAELIGQIERIGRA